ncbi:MAG: DNA-directed RNA polymerase subunit H [Ferroplasma sp.]
MSKFNVLEHENVPEHHLVPEEEENSLLKKLNVTKEDLPKISINDPTIKALEEIHGKLEPGRLIKIIRKSPTAGYYEYYRVIVKSVV